MRLRYNCRLYPAPGQRTALARAFGCARVVFSDALAARQAAHAAGRPYLTDGDLPARLTAAYRNFFASVAGTRKGPKVAPPRFRSRKDHRQAIRFTRNARFAVTAGGKLRLPKIGDVQVRSLTCPRNRPA
jgi:putative transposase